MRFDFLAIICIIFGSAANAEPPTAPHTPPLAVSNEADEEQLALAGRQGMAYARAVDWERQGAPWSSETRAGDYHLIATLTPGEGAWLWEGDHLVWHDAAAGTVHLRVFAEDGADSRFVPGATMRTRILDRSGTALSSLDLPYGIYPVADAYGANITLPAGAASIEISIDPLVWRRHDPYNGDRFGKPTLAVLQLGSVPSITGQLASERDSSAPASIVRDQVTALEDTIRAMYKQANDGAEKPFADYRVVYAVEYAEAYWEPAGADLRYTIENELSGEHNAHVEAAPRDALTGRFLPGLHVTATVETQDGTPVSSASVPLMWHSWLYHYGENWRVPESGTYRLRLSFDPPHAPRYGRANGNRMTKPVDVTFDNVKIKAGQK